MIEQTNRPIEVNSMLKVQFRVAQKMRRPARTESQWFHGRALLDEAVKKPGFIHEAYSRFHSYSLGNQLLVLFQCIMRGIQPGPLATFPKWKQLGRYVKKGEKALTLCMPLTCKRTKTITEHSCPS